MTTSELAKLKLKLPISAATLRRNPADDENRGEASSAKPERAVQHEPLVEAQRTAFYSGRVSVCITSFRTRLLDPDRLCGCYFVDALRYSGILLGDEPDKLDYSIRQEKVASKSLERTEIVVTPL